MFQSIRNRHLLLSDVALLSLAAYASFVLRLESLSLRQFWPGFIMLTLIAVSVIPLSLFAMRGYACFWRYASVYELTLLSAAAALGALGASLLSLLPTTGSPLVPRSVPFIFGPLALAAIATPRMALRLLLSAQPQPSQRCPASQRILVVGAGNTGETLVRELQRDRRREAELLGFVDDDPLKHGLRLHGLPVLGHCDTLPDLISTLHASQVIIAIANLPGKRLRAITALCERAGAQVRIVPGIHELLGGRFTLSQVRDVRIEDLLRREPIQTDVSAVRALIRGQRVLVTGGGGSIGSELCRQVLSCEPAQLIILGHGENSVFEIHAELSARLSALSPELGAASRCQLRTVIADIRARSHLHAILAEHRPAIVFHAAAHKHVPLMELNPAEAVGNNILGTRNLVDAALAADVGHFVMISTDKAVNPTSVMGASKRIAELIVHRAAKLSSKPFVAVRFGNVLGSRGSVVLTFKHQIAAGGPLTVTHPEMRRYFMTIPEAVQLVLQAATIGTGGEVFTLDMGAPVKIRDLARDMIALSGLEPGRDIDIQFSGLRPGEKLYEELFIVGEEYRRTQHQQIFIAANAGAFVPGDLLDQIDALAATARRGERSAILNGLRRLVPQFRPPEQEPAIHEAPAPLARAVGAVRIDLAS
jgi:FlaA1/EpsC-like NDP-sugar epimerase